MVKSISTEKSSEAPTATTLAGVFSETVAEPAVVKPAPYYQQVGTLRVYRADSLWGADRVGLRDFLWKQMGTHLEGGAPPKINEMYMGDILYWWDKVTDRDAFYAFCEGVAAQVKQRFGTGSASMYVTATVEAFLTD
jgi:hypothetical protein